MSEETNEGEISPNDVDTIAVRLRNENLALRKYLAHRINNGDSPSDIAREALEHLHQHDDSPPKNTASNSVSQSNRESQSTSGSKTILIETPAGTEYNAADPNSPLWDIEAETPINPETLQSKRWRQWDLVAGQYFDTADAYGRRIVATWITDWVANSPARTDISTVQNALETCGISRSAARRYVTHLQGEHLLFPPIEDVLFDEETVNRLRLSMAGKRPDAPISTLTDQEQRRFPANPVQLIPGYNAIASNAIATSKRHHYVQTATAAENFLNALVTGKHIKKPLSPGARTNFNFALNRVVDAFEDRLSDIAESNEATRVQSGFRGLAQRCLKANAGSALFEAVVSDDTVPETNAWASAMQTTLLSDTSVEGHWEDDVWVVE